MDPNSKIIKTTHFCDYGPKKNEDIEIDGYWGNLGLKIKGQKKSRWYPVTQKTYENIYISLEKRKLKEKNMRNVQRRY